MVSQYILRCVVLCSFIGQKNENNKSTNVKNKWNKFMKKIKLFDRQFVFYSTIFLFRRDSADARDRRQEK